MEASQISRLIGDISMSLYEQILHTPDNPDAYASAQEAALLTPHKTNLELFRFKQYRSWIFYNHGDDGPDMVIKVEPDPDGSLHKKRSSSVAVVRALYEQGAPVEQHLMTPQRIGQYAVTATEYLPGSYEQATDFRSFGEALALLHMTPLDSLRGQLQTFDPLAVTRNAFKKLRELREKDALPHLDATVFGPSLVDTFQSMLEKSEAAANELIEIANQNGTSPGLLHNDVTPYNTRINKSGETIFIDLDRLMTGPGAYDLGRPIGQWWRFGRPSKMARTLLDGYRSAINEPISSRQIKLGIQAANARYGATLMTRVVDMAMENIPQNTYLLEESINRINGNPYWHSEEEYIRSHMLPGT